MVPDPLAHLLDDLAELDREGLRRQAATPAPADELSFCSNDYLGLAQIHAPPVASGAGASRLLAGERPEHTELERGLSAWLESPASLVFASGYAANVGLISALARGGDLLVSDELNHASLIDGARLSRARVQVVPHLDLRAVEQALRARSEPRAWVVVESYYSMDADGPDLAALRTTCDAHGAALIVDEAHALGVLGPDGRGRCVEAGVTADALVGTLGKSFGSQGAFVVGKPHLRDWLWNRARSFVFSTGLAPASAAAASRSLARIIAHPEGGRRVLEHAAQLREGLLTAGAVLASSDPAIGPPVLLGTGHIVPLVVGTSQRALALVTLLGERGVLAQAIRPPTVPRGGARVRMTVTARHSPATIDAAVRAFAWAMSRL